MEFEKVTRSTDEQAVDATFSALSAQRRRDVVDILADQAPDDTLAGRDAPVSLDGLAAALASREFEREPDGETRRIGCEAPEDAVEDAATALHHIHLPVLADAGIVEYDAEAKSVTPVCAEEFAQLARTVRDDA